MINILRVVNWDVNVKGSMFLKLQQNEFAKQQQVLFLCSLIVFTPASHYYQKNSQNLFCYFTILRNENIQAKSGLCNIVYTASFDF